MVMMVMKREVLISFDTANLAQQKCFDFGELEIMDSNTLKCNNVDARLKHFAP